MSGTFSYYSSSVINIVIPSVVKNLFLSTTRSSSSCSSIPLTQFYCKGVLICYCCVGFFGAFLSHFLIWNWGCFYPLKFGFQIGALGLFVMVNQSTILSTIRINVSIFKSEGDASSFMVTLFYDLILALFASKFVSTRTAFFYMSSCVVGSHSHNWYAKSASKPSRNLSKSNPSSGLILVGITFYTLNLTQ